MDDLAEFIAWIELETFFSGFLLVYAVVYLISSKQAFVRNKILPKLPLAYALTGTLYFALQLKNWYPNYRIDRIMAETQLPYLKLFALLSVFCWLPALRKKAIYCLLHNMVFFFLLMSTSYLQIFISFSSEFAANNIKIYFVSILLNLALVIMITGAASLIVYLKKHTSSHPKFNDKTHYLL